MHQSLTMSGFISRTYILNVLSLIAFIIFNVDLSLAQVPPTPEKSESGLPDLVVSQPKLHLGDVVEGDVMDLTWEIENKGTADLKIDRIKPSCGCTLVDNQNNIVIVKPGEKYNVQAKFNSYNRVGLVEKAVTVYSNDSVQSPLRLQFTANVIRYYVMNPMSGIALLGRVQRGKEATKSLKFYPVPGLGELQLLSVTVNNDKVTPRIQVFEDKSKNTSGYEVVFAIDKNSPPGKINAEGKVSLQVGALKRERDFSVRGNIMGDVQVRPEVLDGTGTPKYHGNSLGPLLIRSTSEGNPIDILYMDCGEYLECIKKVRESNRKQEIVVNMKILDNTPTGPLATRALIVTNSKDQPVIDMPVFGMVLSPVEISPPALVFGIENSSSTELIVIQHTNPTELGDEAQNPELYQVSTSSDFIKAELMPVDPDEQGGQIKINISMNGSFPDNVSSASVWVTTPWKHAKKIEIPVFVLRK